MKDNLLFVNRNCSVIQEFLDAMQDYKFEIDTADSGLDAAILLKKKVYKVVITGLSLSTFDGNKLIAYLNKSCSQTVCIVYTTRVDLAQLKLLVNERDVFRIFLRPANYHGEFYNAITDGFSYYDIRSMDINEREMLEKKRQNAAITVFEMENLEKRRKKEKWELERFLLPLIRLSVLELGPELPAEELKQFIHYEESIMFYYLDKDYTPCKDWEELETRINAEFVQGEENKAVSLEQNSLPQETQPGFFENIHFIIWLLVRQIAAMSAEYDIGITVDFKGKSSGRMAVRSILAEGCWETYHKERLSQILTETVQTITKNLVKDYKRTIKRTGVDYEMELMVGLHGITI